MRYTSRSIISPVLVGRVGEMKLLEMALRTARQGIGQIVLLAGEAGMGKSRLVAEIRQRAAGESFTILEGSCFEHDLLFPYAPLIDALRAFLAAQPTVTVADLFGALAAELVKLLPELALGLPQVQPTRALDPEAEKRRIFETLAQFLIRLTQAPKTAPLLLIPEDLHWCGNQPRLSSPPGPLGECVPRSCVGDLSSVLISRLRKFELDSHSVLLLGSVPHLP